MLVLMIITFIAALVFLYVEKKRRDKRQISDTLQNACSSLSSAIERYFLISSCTRCYESRMYLTEISPNAKSIEYRCYHCGKNARALAGNAGAENVVHFDAVIRESLQRWSLAFGEQLGACVLFEAPELPLPYEQTRREPIPQHVRSEVWRRDAGKCVSCDGQSQLQFDHIIPVSKGGATTVSNLQILCRGCNLEKSNKI